MSGDSFDSGRGGAVGLQWVEVMDAAEHPAGHRTVPPQRRIRP